MILPNGSKSPTKGNLYATLGCIPDPHQVQIRNGMMYSFSDLPRYDLNGAPERGITVLQNGRIYQFPGGWGQ